MTILDKLKLRMIGKRDEEVSWLFLFLLSSVVSGVLGLIITLIDQLL